jgi:hypothetical protein
MRVCGSRIVVIRSHVAPAPEVSTCASDGSPGRRVSTGAKSTDSAIIFPTGVHAGSTQPLVSNVYSPQSVSSKTHSRPFESSDHSSQWSPGAASSRSMRLDSSNVHTRPPSMAETSTALPPYTPSDPSQQIQNPTLSPGGTNINHLE